MPFVFMAFSSGCPGVPFSSLPAGWLTDPPKLPGVGLRTRRFQLLRIHHPADPSDRRNFIPAYPSRYERPVRRDCSRGTSSPPTPACVDCIPAYPSLV